MTHRSPEFELSVKCVFQTETRGLCTHGGNFFRFSTLFNQYLWRPTLHRSLGGGGREALGTCSCLLGRCGVLRTVGVHRLSPPAQRGQGRPRRGVDGSGTLCPHSRPFPNDPVERPVFLPKNRC